MEILDRDGGIELVTASLWDGVPSKSPTYGADFVAVRGGMPLLVEVKLTTPQTSRRWKTRSASCRPQAGRT